MKCGARRVRDSSTFWHFDLPGTASRGYAQPWTGHKPSTKAPAGKLDGDRVAEHDAWVPVELTNPLWIGGRGLNMKLLSWGFLAIIGTLAFLGLYLADREMNAGVDRLQHMKLHPNSAVPSEKLADGMIDVLREFVGQSGI
jgi:hypothetical protein